VQIKELGGHIGDVLRGQTTLVFPFAVCLYEPIRTRRHRFTPRLAAHTYFDRFGTTRFYESNFIRERSLALGKIRLGVAQTLAIALGFFNPFEEVHLPHLVYGIGILGDRRRFGWGIGRIRLFDFGDGRRRTGRQLLLFRDIRRGTRRCPENHRTEKEKRTTRLHG